MRPTAIQAVGQRSGRFAVVPARAIDDARLQAAAFKVLCALSTYSDRDGRCWPSMGAVARRLGVTRQAVNRQVHVLVETGYLSITPRQRGDGSTSTHSYRLIFDAELAGVHDRLGDEFEEAKGRQHEVDSQPSVDGKRQHRVTPPATSDVAPILERTNKNLTVDPSEEVAKQFEIFWRFYPRR
jgi:DNA-binding MarR family transcriptional regulator